MGILVCNLGIYNSLLHKKRPAYFLKRMFTFAIYCLGKLNKKINTGVFLLAVEICIEAATIKKKLLSTRDEAIAAASQLPSFFLSR